MANQNDHFIDEVTEDLRRDRLFLLMRRYGWVAALLIVALVGGAAWREYARAQEAASARAFGDAILAAQQAAGEDAAARARAIAAIATDNPRQTMLRDILAGNALVEAGDIAAAGQRYDTAATAAGNDVVIRDLAALKSVIAQGPDMDPAARDAALTRLSAPGAPFEMIAHELKAIALAGAGRREDAVTLIRQIQKMNGLSGQMRQRLADHLVTLGADPDPEAATHTAPDPTLAAEVVHPADEG